MPCSKLVVEAGCSFQTKKQEKTEGDTTTVAPQAGPPTAQPAQMRQRGEVGEGAMSSASGQASTSVGVTPGASEGRGDGTTRGRNRGKGKRRPKGVERAGTPANGCGGGSGSSGGVAGSSATPLAARGVSSQGAGVSSSIPMEEGDDARSQPIRPRLAVTKPRHSISGLMTPPAARSSDAQSTASSESAEWNMASRCPVYCI